MILGFMGSVKASTIHNLPGLFIDFRKLRRLTILMLDPGPDIVLAESPEPADLESWDLFGSGQDLDGPDRDLEDLGHLGRGEKRIKLV